MTDFHTVPQGGTDFLLWQYTGELEDEICMAARAYEYKFNQKPNVCYVHRSVLPKGKTKVLHGVVVSSRPFDLKGHLSIGRE